MVPDRIAGRVSVKCINAGSVPENYLEKIVALEPQTILFIDAALRLNSDFVFICKI